MKGDTDKHAERAQNGTYKHTAGDCVCGHHLDKHTAERAKVNGVYYQDCLDEECDCMTFKKGRK